MQPPCDGSTQGCGLVPLSKEECFVLFYYYYLQSFLQIFHFSLFFLNVPELERSKIKENQSKLIVFAYVDHK